jgi:hypothetical protein
MEDHGLKSIEHLIRLVEKENNRQIEKWGIQDHASPEWMLILNEEVGELNKAVLEHWINTDILKDDDLIIEIIKEAISVATLSLKIIEMFEL